MSLESNVVGFFLFLSTAAISGRTHLCQKKWKDGRDDLFFNAFWKRQLSSLRTTAGRKAGWKWWLLLPPSCAAAHCKGHGVQAGFKLTWDWPTVAMPEAIFPSSLSEMGSCKHLRLPLGWHGPSLLVDLLLWELHPLLWATGRQQQMSNLYSFLVKLPVFVVVFVVVLFCFVLFY